jgi:hypothetical protein
MKLTPSLKGFITAFVMIALVLGIYYSKRTPETNLQYLIYIIYALGIAWTLIAYKQSSFFTGKFADTFGQGFRCFIVVTLLMVLFTGIFSKMHPEFAEETSIAYREQLVQQNDKTPTEIEKEVSDFKKQYTLKLISGSIFGYLILGAAVTATVAALLTRRK